MTTDTLSMNRRSMLRGSITVAGAAIVLPAMGGLAGCSSGAGGSLAGKLELIDAVSDLVIPQTDTPGARLAGVPAYIEAVFTDHFTTEQQDDFAAGLSVFDDMAKNAGTDSFTSASAEQQSAILTELDTGPRDMTGKATWQQLRDMSIFGFYTSEQATEELKFEEIPGRYDACAPLEEVGRAWLNRGV